MNKRFSWLVCTLGAFLPVSCSQPSSTQPATLSEMRYASLLTMQAVGQHSTFVRIANPWHTDVTAKQYLLVPGTETTLADTLLAQAERQYGAVTLLHTPLCQQTITSTCHAWLLHELDALQSIGVMCDTGYLRDSTMLTMIANGEIADGGNGMAPNAEVLFAKQSDAIWISPFEGAGLPQQISRKVPVIYCADYMETSPLGRAEWMRFYGRLVGREQMADSLFNVVATNYDSICSLANTRSSRTVISDLPYSGTWFIAGGQSTMGQLYRDAGLRYPWADDTHAGSLSLAPEAVFAKGHEAQLWLIKYNSADGDWTMDELLQQNTFFPQFAATQNGGVYGCNTAKSDYFDVTPFRPDWLLEELEHLNDEKTDSLRFFKKLE